MDVDSVESYCNLLARSKLLAAADVRTLRGRWLKESGRAVNDLPAFTRWLIANQYVTDYQSNLLLRGKIERFFLSDYKLLERIGKGRMAGIYKAVDRLGQPVAIKVLPPSKVRDVQTFGRFQREARLAVKLKHPHIVRTLQTGEELGLHYIVMEYLDGQTLDEMLYQRGKLSATEALPLLVQALYGLQYLHEQDIVHRDLKPANLMLLPSLDAAGRSAASLRILDIGLGRALFDEGGNDGAAAVELTTEGALLGEPDYLAPEQARDAHAADIRADLYSLGCVLYHMLAGQPPFVDANRVRKLVRHATEAPRPVKEHNPSVPDAVQQLLDRLMAKDPAQRFATPGDAVKAVLSVLAILPAPAPPVTKPTAPPPNIPLAMPVPAAPPPAAAPVANLTFDPIASAPAVPSQRRSWVEHLHADRRDVIVFGLGVLVGLMAFGVGLLIAKLLTPR